MDAYSNNKKAVFKMAAFQADEMADPVQYLNKECVVHIFSFVVGKFAKDGIVSARLEYASIASMADHQKIKNEKEAMRVNEIEAGKFYLALASVSRGWKKIMDEFIAVLATNLRVELNFDGLERRKECIEWIFRHKLTVRAIDCNLVKMSEGLGYLASYALLSQLLTSPLCDTSKIDTVDIIVLLGSEEERCRSFQQLVAAQCPNLEDLRVLLFRMDGEERRESSPNVLCPSLFSRSSIDNLTIIFDASCANGDVHDSLLVSLHQHLPGLRFLNVGCRSETWSPSINIRSKSLRYVSFFISKSTRVRISLACPNLKMIACEGSPVENEPMQWHLSHTIIPEDVPGSCALVVVSDKHNGSGIVTTVQAAIQRT